MNTSYLFLANGFEELEALTVVDVMRRAGMDIKTVSITDSLTVTGAHGITVTADVLFSKTDFITPEWLILPGGMPGATNLSEFAPLNTLLVAQAAAGKIAAGHSRRERLHLLPGLREAPRQSCGARFAGNRP